MQQKRCRRSHWAGLKIAVATSGTREWIDSVIAKLGLVERISVSISGADVHQPKPHPQEYLVATNTIGVPAGNCGVVEDSERGCHSAVAAGCVVVILDRENREPEQFTGAAVVTTSMPQARDFLLQAAHSRTDNTR